MPNGRSLISRLALAAVAIVAAPSPGLTQPDFPSRPIRFVVPSGPGSAPDLIPRLLGEGLTARWGQPAVIEHRPGAGGNLGAEFVSKAAPDGNTLLSTWSSPLVVNQSLYAKIKYDPAAFVVIAVIATSPNVLVVHPKVPAASLRDLIAYAKANPDKLTYASVGIGGTPHLAMEMLKAAAGIDIRRIPYNRGLAPAIADTLAGQVDMVFGNLADVRTHIANGAVRALGVGSEKRVADLPGVPAIAELYPGYLNVAWYAFVAPPKTPDAIARKLADAVADILKRPEIAGRMRELGLTTLSLSPAETAAFIKGETERWGKVIQATGIRAE
jgi:tripartite-type tricarboxylate transporter receptor subunit TctC